MMMSAWLASACANGWTPDFRPRLAGSFPVGAAQAVLVFAIGWCCCAISVERGLFFFEEAGEVVDRFKAELFGDVGDVGDVGD